MTGPNGNGPNGSAPNGAGPNGVGGLGDEARALLGAVQDWAQRTLPAPPSGHPGPECQWCPLCQLASVLRGEHPELSELAVRLAETGTAVSGALRALLDSAVNRSQPGPGHGVDASAPESTASPRVERIRLVDRSDVASPRGQSDVASPIGQSDPPQPDPTDPR